MRPDPEKHIDYLIARDREKWRRINNPTRQEKVYDFFWHIQDEGKLLARAFWNDLVVPLAEFVAYSVAFAVVVVTVGYLFALGFRLAE